MKKRTQEIFTERINQYSRELEMMEAGVEQTFQQILEILDGNSIDLKISPAGHVRFVRLLKKPVHNIGFFDMDYLQLEPDLDTRILVLQYIITNLDRVECIA